VNKQGRSGVMDEGDMHQRVFQREAAGAFAMYKARLDNGMSKELARINLPLSAYTRWYWKIDLHNLLHFLGLRLDKHAQYEIRVFAEAMATFVKARCPLAWEAFEDFRLNAVTFSAVEMEVLAGLVGDGWNDGIQQASDGIDWPTSREREEFVGKLMRLLK
jgi:thymidylate synthase (FAD)